MFDERFEAQQQQKIIDQKLIECRQKLISSENEISKEQKKKPAVPFFISLLFSIVVVLAFLKTVQVVDKQCDSDNSDSFICNVAGWLSF
jgi:hypothetical protein